MEETRKSRREVPKTQVGAKRRKIEVEGIVWGESIDVQQHEREEFLASGRAEPLSRSTQPKLKVLTGHAWLAHQVVREMAGMAVDRAWEVSLATDWEVWEGDVPARRLSTQPPASPPQLNIMEEGTISRNPPTKPRRGGKKNLPGVSGTQKSVATYFKPETKSNRRQIMLIVDNNISAKSAKKKQNFAIAGVAIRQENIFSSPVSNKTIYNKKSVAEITKLVGCLEGGGSSTTKSESIKENIHSNSSCNQGLHFRQKLAKFHAPNPENSPENS